MGGIYVLGSPRFDVSICPGTLIQNNDYYGFSSNAMGRRVIKKLREGLEPVVLG